MSKRPEMPRKEAILRPSRHVLHFHVSKGAQPAAPKSRRDPKSAPSDGRAPKARCKMSNTANRAYRVAAKMEAMQTTPWRGEESRDLTPFLGALSSSRSGLLIARISIKAGIGRLACSKARCARSDTSVAYP